MVHYKVNVTLCEGLVHGMHAFCGMSVDTPGEEFHVLGMVPSSPAYWRRPVVNCPKCIRMFDAVANDILGRHNP